MGVRTREKVCVCVLERERERKRGEKRGKDEFEAKSANFEKEIKVCLATNKMQFSHKLKGRKHRSCLP